MTNIASLADGRVRNAVVALSTSVSTILQPDQTTDALKIESVSFGGEQAARASLYIGSVPVAVGVEVPQRVISRNTPLYLTGSQQLRASASQEPGVSAIVSYVRVPGPVPSVPDAPVILSTEQNLQGTTLELVFVPPSDNGSPIIGYIVWVDNEQLPTQDLTVSQPFTFGGLVYIEIDDTRGVPFGDGLEVSFEVAAENSIGVGPRSTPYIVPAQI